ncbi:MAG: methanol dehydrogenase [Kiloniellaceae bacterium]|nr:methanol dehydrogenase [Kiloniellaceae bacterium]
MAGPALAALDFPPLTGRVVDNADLLSAEEERRLTEQLASLEQGTSSQLVVVTLPSLQGTAIEDFGYQLGRHWGIGQLGRDNGVLLIVAPNERKVRIEVGYGLEGDLPDATAKIIIENEILPSFRAGDYPRGIADGVDAIILAVAGAYEPRRDEGRVDDTLEIFIFFGLILLVLGISYYFGEYDLGRRRGHLGGRGPYHHGHSGGFGGGFGGRGDGGGGGFSGGGGGFGGGGSSGSW